MKFLEKKFIQYFAVYPLIIIFAGIILALFLPIQQRILWVVYIIGVLVFAYTPGVVLMVLRDRRLKKEDLEFIEKYSYLIGQEVQMETVIAYTQEMIFHLDGVAWHCAYDERQGSDDNKYKIVGILGKERADVELVNHQ